MSSIMKKPLFKKAIAVITAILVVIATIILYQNFVQTQSNQGVEESFEKELAELFVKTIIYCNETRQDMLESYYRIPHKIPISRNEIIELLDQYYILSKTFFIPENFPFTNSSQIPELQQILWRAFRSYYVIANDTLIAYNTGRELEEIMPVIAKSLSYLAKCDVENGLNEYLKIEPELTSIINNLNRIYYDLSSIDEKTLLSEEHRKTLREAINTTSKILASLTKYKQIMILIKNNPEEYKQICFYAHDQLDNFTQDAQQLLWKLANILQDLSNLGSATSSLNAFTNTINNALYKETIILNNQSNQGSNQQGQGTGQQNQNISPTGGSGAGYHNLTETD